MNQIDKYVWGRLELANFGNEVIHIQKAQLLSIEKVKIRTQHPKRMIYNSNDSFYLSGIKSLDLNSVDFFNLSVFPNLRHLYLTCESDAYKENSQQFQCTNTHMLQTLKIKIYNLSPLNNILNNLLNLEKLEIKTQVCDIPLNALQLNQLLNLKYLCIDRQTSGFFFCRDFPTIKNLKNLEFFSISHCSLFYNNDDDDDDCFDGLSNLEYLFLHEVEFKNLKCLPKLNHLSIYYQYWPEYDFSIKNVLPNLQRLSLKSKHEIELLDEGIFSGLKSLRWLDIEGEQLRILNKNVFNDLENLEHLYLSLYSTQDLDEEFFSGLKSLRWLDIDWFKLRILNKNVFNGLENLEYLSLKEFIEIEVLNEGFFSGFKSLKCLYLTRNELRKLDKNVFSGLDKLENLDLSHNKIEVLNEGIFSGLKSLKCLYLTGNQLRKLDKNVFNGLDNLKKLVLSDNPLDDVKATLTDLKQINDFINVRI